MAAVNHGALAVRIVDELLDLAENGDIGRAELAIRVAALLEPGLAGIDVRRANGRAAIIDVQLELDRIIDRRPPYASAHEGWAVITEELHELEQHVFADTGYSAAAYDEAIQVAATAARYAAELCREGRP